jgi:hypothetical protein
MPEALLSSPLSGFFLGQPSATIKRQGPHQGPLAFGSDLAWESNPRDAGRERGFGEHCSPPRARALRYAGTRYQSLLALDAGGWRLEGFYPHRIASSPLRSMRLRSFRDVPPGFLSPASHFCTVDKLVLSTAANTA